MDLLKRHVNFLTLIEIGYKVVGEASVDADFVANAANISYDMAMKYIDALIKSKVIGEPDEDGKCAVFLTVAGFEDKIKSSGLTLGEEERELEFSALFPEAKYGDEGEDDEDFDEDDEDFDEDDEDFDEDDDDDNDLFGDEDFDDEGDDDDLFGGSFSPLPDYDNAEDEVKYTSKLICEFFDSFNVEVSIKSVDLSPRLMRFAIVPARGVKVSTVLNLQDDIALYLAAGSIRMETPIPGKNAIGIEIPRRRSEVVHLSELFECDEVKNSISKTEVAIGRDIENKPVLLDVARMPHALVSGATGMGKSCLIDCIITGIAKKATPDRVRFILIDPKTVEFTKYKGLPHLLSNPIHAVPEIIGALKWANDEMERRYSILQQNMALNIDEYNEKAPASEALPRIIIVIDELTDIMISSKCEAEAYIGRITQKARAAGIHLIIGTQRPSVSVITGAVKANIPSRICFKTSSYMDSRVVLDMSGAERLLDRGDMLVSYAGAIKPIRAQCAFISSEEIDDIVKSLKTGEGSFDEGLLSAMKNGAKLCAEGVENVNSAAAAEVGLLNDPQFLDAVDIALSQGVVSTALLQRRLSIGFGKAARFIDAMEEMGIVSEKRGAKPREVLLSREEWIDKLSRIEL